jgi:hypothetical protein
MMEEGLEFTTVETPAGSQVQQLSVFLANRVGSLMSLVKLLRDHSIEVLGLSVQDSTELTLVRLVLSDPEGAQALFIEKGIAHTVVEVVVVELAGEERDMNHCLSVLLAAEVNIHFLYALLARPGHHPVMVVQCDDGEVCASSLHQAGFHVLMQEELSR